MKRSILLIISLYLFSISGMAAQFHFCGGNLETISLGYEETTKCCCKTTTKSKSCCKSEQVKPEVSSHFSAKQQIVEPLTFIAIQVLLFPELLTTTTLINGETDSNLPFKDYRVPIFIKNCTYLL